MGSLRFVRLLAVALVLNLGGVSLTLAASGGGDDQPRADIRIGHEATAINEAGYIFRLPVQIKCDSRYGDSLRVGKWYFHISVDDPSNLLDIAGLRLGYCLNGESKGNQGKWGLWFGNLQCDCIFSDNYTSVGTLEVRQRYVLSNLPQTFDVTFDRDTSNTYIYALCDDKEMQVQLTYLDGYISVDNLPPSSVTGLSVSLGGSDYVSLTWTAPGNDGNQGTASRYDIRYSTSSVGADTAAWWEGADTVADESSPAPAGTEQQFKVEGLTPHSTYYFALRSADEVPNWSGVSNIASGAPVGVKGRKTSELPAFFTLFPNYPNPFNPETEIRYGLPVSCQVSLEVYNITGEKVVTLVNEKQEAGYHRVVWDASGMASGIYLYRIKAGIFSKTQKMVLLK